MTQIRKLEISDWPCGCIIRLVVRSVNWTEFLSRHDMKSSRSGEVLSLSESNQRISTTSDSLDGLKPPHLLQLPDNDYLNQWCDHNLAECKHLKQRTAKLGDGRRSGLILSLFNGHYRLIMIYTSQYMLTAVISLLTVSAHYFCPLKNCFRKTDELWHNPTFGKALILHSCILVFSFYLNFSYYLIIFMFSFTYNELIWPTRVSEARFLAHTRLIGQWVHAAAWPNITF